MSINRKGSICPSQAGENGNQGSQERLFSVYKYNAIHFFVSQLKMTLCGLLASQRSQEKFVSMSV